MLFQRVVLRKRVLSQRVTEGALSEGGFKTEGAPSEGGFQTEGGFNILSSSPPLLLPTTATMDGI